MRQEQWEKLLAVIDGEVLDPLPVGFIIDSPWLPGWAGVSMLEYYSDGRVWLDTNLKACNAFPEIMFLPGFWSEYGMCTEPSAFGSRCTWDEHEFPFAEPIASTAEEAAAIHVPDPARNGMLPFVLKRLEMTRGAIEDAGYSIRFAVARGPLNVASFLMGQTEFLMAMKLEPEKTHALLNNVTDFLVKWLQLQASRIDTIDGILLLDDIVGFVGDDDFREFAFPYLKRSFEAIDSSVRFFHNDARGLVCAPHLPEIGVNLFNFAFDHTLSEMKELTDNRVTLLGNIPPRDVLASGTPDHVTRSVSEAIESVEDKSRIILSCGGGMPPEVSSENIEAFLRTAVSL